MIFTYALADAISDGSKTVTRRPCTLKNGRAVKPPEVGSLMPIQRGYNKATFSVLVTSVARQEAFRPDWHDDVEGRAEGFANGEAFYYAWSDIYGFEPVDVWRIEFARVSGESGDAA